MDKKLREKLVEGVEKSIKTVGASSYEEGMEVAKRITGWAHDRICSLQTANDLRAMLDAAPPMSKKETAFALFLAAHLPQAMRLMLKIAAQKAPATYQPLRLGGQRLFPSIGMAKLSITLRSCTETAVRWR